MPYNDHKHQIGIWTSYPIVWIPVSLSSHSDLKLVLQTVPTGNCNYFSPDPTENIY